jgi:hypothetical protein
MRLRARRQADSPAPLVVPEPRVAFFGGQNGSSVDTDLRVFDSGHWNWRRASSTRCGYPAAMPSARPGLEIRLGWGWLLVANGMAAGCHPAPSTGDREGPAVGTEADDLRESARAVLLRECGECHNRELDSAMPRALRVYDLTELDWSRRMTAEQLHDAESRLADDSVPVIGHDELRPLRVSPDERERFHAYVVRVLAEREAGATSVATQ